MEGTGGKQGTRYLLPGLCARILEAGAVAKADTAELSALSSGRAEASARCRDACSAIAETEHVSGCVSDCKMLCVMLLPAAVFQLFSGILLLVPPQVCSLANRGARIVSNPRGLLPGSIWQTGCNYLSLLLTPNGVFRCMKCMLMGVDLVNSQLEVVLVDCLCWMHPTV